MPVYLTGREKREGRERSLQGEAILMNVLILSLVDGNNHCFELAFGLLVRE